MWQFSKKKLLIYFALLLFLLLLSFKFNRKTKFITNPNSPRKIELKYYNRKSGSNASTLSYEIRHDKRKTIFPYKINTVSPMLLDTNVHRKLVQNVTEQMISPANERPWYMEGGKVIPTNNENDLSVNQLSKVQKLFPAENSSHDRIPEQLMFLPSNYHYQKQFSEETDKRPSLKTILLWNWAGTWTDKKGGREEFINEMCPVNSCTILTRDPDYQKADMVLFKDDYTKPNFDRPKNQIWMMFNLESPKHTSRIDENIFDWTATYRSDSTIVAPYGRWQYYNNEVRQLPLKRNYLANKTKSVAWFVSNCDTQNQRMEYAIELSKHIQVDIYGSCGSFSCSTLDEDSCFKLLDKDYRFYLAFENSNCKDYITEKFWRNGLSNDIIPIVMGARPEDYKRVAPDHSYIHVEDFTGGPKDLAQYLKTLESSEDLYNQYFKWKGTGEMINTKFLCRVCALLHEPNIITIYPGAHKKNFNEWWDGNGICLEPLKWET